MKVWREQGWPGVTNTTAALLRYWNNPERERRLFFCQIEAVETALYLTEIADKAGDAWLPNELRTRNETANPGLYRIALKMATGSGKTLVMGMLIAWQVLNKIQNPQDARFSDSFLLVAPGITIRDRLRVLLPNDAENYYRLHDLVPPDLFTRLSQARIVITNFHAFLFREKTEASGRATEADDCYVADIPDLSFCSAFGDTPEGALAEVEQAKQAWLAAARETGKPIPEPRYRSAIDQLGK